MSSYCADSFWDQYHALPEHLREAADDAYALWCKDTSADSLKFKRVPNKPDWWSARITRAYRAVAIKDGEDYIWFFIGNHDDYIRLISR